MDKNKYLEDLQEIKKLMNRSSKFLSLSGLSGVFAGVYALLGVFVADYLINEKIVVAVPYTRTQTYLLVQLLGLAFVILLLSIATAFIFSYRKAKRQKTKMWDETAKNLLFHFLLPLLTGGLFALILISRQYYGLIAAITLIFYGLALVNSAKYTYGTILYLGISEIILGLLATAFPGYGLWFWALGFGVLHIFYGGIMYFKFDRK